MNYDTVNLIRVDRRDAREGDYFTGTYAQASPVSNKLIRTTVEGEIWRNAQGVLMVAPSMPPVREVVWCNVIITRKPEPLPTQPGIYILTDANGVRLKGRKRLLLNSRGVWVYLNDSGIVESHDSIIDTITAYHRRGGLRLDYAF